MYEDRYNITQPNRRYAYADFWKTSKNLHFAFDRVKFQVNKKGNQFYSFDVNEKMGTFIRYKVCIHANPKHPPTLMIWEGWDKGHWWIHKYGVFSPLPVFLRHIQDFWDNTGPFVDESIPKLYRQDN